MTQSCLITNQSELLSPEEASVFISASVHDAMEWCAFAAAVLCLPKRSQFHQKIIYFLVIVLVKKVVLAAALFTMIEANYW
jgi:hypothetical protein